MAEKKEESKVDSILDQASDFFDESGVVQDFYVKYKNAITYAGASVIILIAGYFGFHYYTESQNVEAQAQMYQSVYYFESDSLKKALNGDGNNPGLVEIADDYSLTKAGKLASFYVGVIYIKQGKIEDAIEYLKKFNASDLLLQARAYSLIGDAYMELGELEEAISYYVKASDNHPNKEFTPIYLMKLGLAYEQNKNYAEAALAYDKIVTQYPNSAQVADARKYKAMNETLAAGE